MMSMPNQKSEEEWQAESDAHTLAEAELIKGDEKRHGKAQEAAKRLADEAQERAFSMKKIAEFYGKKD